MNKNKKIKLITMAILFMFIMPTTVFAISENINPGILPDSPFYGFKRGFEQVNMFLTFNKVDKAELQYKYALTRLSESKIMTEKGKIQLANRAMNEYENGLNQAKLMVQQQLNKQNSLGIDTALEQLQIQINSQQQVNNQQGVISE